MSKKVLIISTSLRPNANSEILARETERGALDAGCEVEFVDYHVGKCLINDDNKHKGFKRLLSNSRVAAYLPEVTSIATEFTILPSLSLNKMYAVPCLTGVRPTLLFEIVLLASIKTVLSEDSTV